MAQRYIFLNTVDRDISSSSAADATWRLSNNIPKAKVLTLVEARIPQTTYNINSRNKTLQFELASVPFTSTLTEGFYASGTDLATELKTQMDSDSGGNFTISYSGTTSKYTFAEATSCELLFSTLAGSQPHSDLFRILGFVDGSGRPIDTGTAATLTSTVAGVLYPNNNVLVNLYLNSTKVGNTEVPPGQRCSFILPSIASYGGVFQSTKNEFDYTFPIVGEDVNSIRVVLLDRFGRTLELNNGESTFLFKVSE